MKLIIVESPAKCGKIESFLGANYKCLLVLVTLGKLQMV